MRSTTRGVRAQTRALAQNAAAVAATLRAAVTVPEAPHGAPAIVMLMGFPGVGKTHIARMLAVRLGAAHVSSDQIRSHLFVAPSYRREESETVFRMVDQLVGDLVAEGHRVIVDATHLRASQRASVARLARRRGVALTHVLVTAEEPAILERLASRRRERAPHDRSEADERVYAMMRDRGFEPPPRYLTIRNGPGLEDEVARVGAMLEREWE